MGPQSKIDSPPPNKKGRSEKRTGPFVVLHQAKSVGVPDARATFKVTRGIGWLGHTGTNRLAVFVQTLAQVALNAVIDNPVVAAIGINPNARLKLAEVLFIKTPVKAFVGRVSTPALKVATCSQAKGAGRDQ